MFDQQITINIRLNPVVTLRMTDQTEWPLSGKGKF